jgi:arylsulfatase A-like enzyme
MHWKSESSHRAAAPTQWRLLARLVILAVFIVVAAISFLHLSSRKPYNLVFICIDTLRPDRLGYCGHTRNTSPNIDSIAAEGVVFERCYSQTGWTLPAMATIFTGEYPKDHGATDFHFRMDHRLPTLASILRELGYDTRGYVSHVVLTPRYGFAKGFRKFDYSVLNLGHPHDVATAEPLTDLALRDISDISEPFFIWLHYFDPHFEYLKHDGWAHFGSTDVDRYDGEIAHTDYHIGRFLDHLEAQGFKEHTVVVITSDHGEEFGEHGGQYHYTLYEEVLRVPLIIRAPFLDPRTEDLIVEQIDLLPTMLSTLGVESSPDLPGRDILDSPSSRRPVFLERDRPPPYRQRGVILDDHKLTVVEVVDPTILPAESRGTHSRVANVTPGISTYDLCADPQEKINTFGDRASDLEELLTTLAAHFEGRGGGSYQSKVEIDDALREKLRSLGYLE